MLTTKKFKIQIDEQMKTRLFELSNIARVIYNEFLKRRIDSYVATKSIPNYYQQSRELTRLLREDTSLKQLESSTRRQILRRLETNYRSFFGNLKNVEASTPHFHGKNYFFTLEWTHSGYKLDEQTRILTLSQGKGYEKIQIQLPQDYGSKLKNIRQITVRFDGKDFWISLIGDIDTLSYIDNQKYVAIDAGVTNIATLLTNDGNLEITSNNDFSKNEKIADCLQSYVAKKKKNSKRYFRSQAKYRKLRRKTSNQRRNFQHHVAKNIIKNFEANTIFVEKLDTKSMSQANPYWHKLNRKTQNTGSLSLFLQLLAQKASRYGKKVVAIDPRNTSRMCHNCGKIHQDLQLWDRTVVCSCGTIVDRDLNACINIMSRGFETLQLPESTRYRFDESIRCITQQRIAA